jgi:hypothetical protein
MSTWKCTGCGRTSGPVPEEPTLDERYRRGFCSRALGGCGRRTTWAQADPPPIERGPPPVARLTDPATSHAAARSVGDTGTIRARILELIRTEGPLTDEELLELFERRHPASATPSGIRTRRKELVDMGYLEDSGQRGTTRAGRQAAIWQPNGYRRPA